MMSDAVIFNPESHAIITPDGSTNVITAWSSAFEDLEVWQQLAEAIDEVFAVKIQQPTDLMLLLRHTVQYAAPIVEAAIVPVDDDNYEGTLLDDSARLFYERTILVMTANLLGF